jgi:hypothetical protein
LATHAKQTTGHLRHTSTGSVATPLEIRRQNSVLRRLIDHVRTFSPETGDNYETLENETKSDEAEQPIAHRRPFVGHGQSE